MVEKRTYHKLVLDVVCHKGKAQILQQQLDACNGVSDEHLKIIRQTHSLDKRFLHETSYKECHKKFPLLLASSIQRVRDHVIQQCARYKNLTKELNRVQHISTGLPVRQDALKISRAHSSTHFTHWIRFNGVEYPLRCTRDLHAVEENFLTQQQISNKQSFIRRHRLATIVKQHVAEVKHERRRQPLKRNDTFLDPCTIQDPGHYLDGAYFRKKKGVWQLCIRYYVLTEVAFNPTKETWHAPAPIATPRTSFYQQEKITKEFSPLNPSENYWKKQAKKLGRWKIPYTKIVHHTKDSTELQQQPASVLRFSAGITEKAKKELIRMRIPFRELIHCTTEEAQLYRRQFEFAPSTCKFEFHVFGHQPVQPSPYQCMEEPLPYWEDRRNTRYYRDPLQNKESDLFAHEETRFRAQDLPFSEWGSRNDQVTTQLTKAELADIVQQTPIWRVALRDHAFYAVNMPRPPRSWFHEEQFHFESPCPPVDPEYQEFRRKYIERHTMWAEAQLALARFKASTVVTDQPSTTPESAAMDELLAAEIL